jgi:hypothetical protein
MGDAGGGLEGRAPGSGARDGFFGACEAGAKAAFGRGAGAVVAGWAGARAGGALTPTSADDWPTPDSSSGPLGSGGGGFTLAPRLPMLGFTIPHPTVHTMMTDAAKAILSHHVGGIPVASITVNGWEGGTLNGGRCKLCQLADLRS